MLNSFKLNELGWCVIGEFNDFRSNDEKVESRLRNESQMVLFRQVLERGNLFDLGWKGEKLTWSNRHGDATYTKERLDRVLANQVWLDNYIHYEVESLAAICYDHRPLLLDCAANRAIQMRGSSSFKYEASWSKEEGCGHTVAS